jgi:hypothetical protein
MAACMLLSTLAPTSYAQTAATWQAGPGAVGSSTYIGRIEAPTARRSINPGASLLVSGWAADTTAQGWAGIDGVEVWAGAQGSGGTKLATGSVGQPRPDIAESIGSSFTNSGFSAVVPSGAWSNIQPGPVNLYVYIHTPNKGSWYRTVAGTLVAAPALPFPTDPVVFIAKPQEGMNITQRQVTNQITFSGVALDRNPLDAVQNSLALLAPGIGQTTSGGCPACLGATNRIYTQFNGAGVDYVTVWLDHLPKPGEQSFGLSGAACPGCTQGVAILVNSKGFLNRADKPQGSIITDAEGQSADNPNQFRFGGWVFSFNPMLLDPGPHTLYVTAHSTITGKTSAPATVDFNILAFKQGQPIQP